MAGRARHLESTEDRTVVYRDWHRKNLPDECKVMDVDQLEYRFDRDGHIQFRAIIELTIFDPAAQWVVDPRSFKSKSKNSPFGGYKLTGKPVGGLNNSQVYWAP